MLDGLGQPIGTPARLSTLTDTDGPFLPFIGATGFGQVFLAYGTTSGALLDRFALPAGPPGPRLSHVSVQITTPANNRTVASPFVIAGTALDLSADAGSGVDMVSITATPKGGSPIALGETQQFDNGACPTHFSPCAFQIPAAGLMPGVTYTLTASARSTVTGATSAAATLEVTIASKRAADVTPLGTTNLGTARSGGLTAIAHDDKDDVVLQVWEDAASALSGRFVHGDGGAAGEAFTIAAPQVPGARMAWPAAACSRGSVDRIFLVVFTEEVPLSSPRQATAYGQLVRYVASDPAAAALVGGRVALDPAAAGWTQSSDVAFNPIARRFAAMWVDAVDAWARSVGVDGSPAGSPVNVSSYDLPEDSPTFPRGLTPRLGFDWQHNRYAVEFLVQNAFSPIAGSHAVMQVLDGTTMARIGARLDLEPSIDSSSNLAAAYLPVADGVLMAWTPYVIVALPGATQYGRVTSTDPAVAAGGIMPLMQSVTASSLDYDAISNLTLTAGAAASGLSAGILDAAGRMVSETFALPGGPAGTIGALAVRAMNGGMFAVGYVDGTSVVLQRVRLAAADTPGPRFSNVWSNLDGPSSGVVVGRSFEVMGWAIDVATATGTGVDAFHVWAYPSAGGGAIFLGATSAPVARPDLGAAFGAQFVNAGFQIHASGLPAGTYTIVPYARSAISGAFTSVGAASVTVASQPVMCLDLPWNGSIRRSGFAVGGWAIDLSADAGQNGIDVMHVWAYPPAGAPVFLGAAPVVRPRADVEAIYGSQFANSGFWLDSAPLTPGSYTIVAYAHSGAFGAFTGSQAVGITIPVPATPMMTIDTPPDGATAAQPFLLAGWAIDRDAPSGTGIDAVHVWAFPDNGAAVFIGAAATGGVRGDVAAIYGAQFATSGYNLAVTGLATGSYQIVVYAHSSVTGTFSQWRVVRVAITP